MVMFKTHNLRNHARHLVALVGLTPWLMLPGHSVSRPEQSESPETRVKEAYGKLPLNFEANQGQTDARVKFLARGSGYGLFLTSEEAVLTLNRSRGSGAGDWATPLEHNQPGPTPQPPIPATLRMKLLRANPAPSVVGVDALPG